MNNPLSPESMLRIAALHTWTVSPAGGVESLEHILKSLTDNELIYITAIFAPGEPVGRIAWVEYAKRRGYFDFEIRMIQVSPGQVKLILEAEGEAVHASPSLGVKAS